MRLATLFTGCQAVFFSLAAFCLGGQAALADWQRDENTLAWKADGKVVWRFSFDSSKGKPFFDPLTVAGGPALTNFKPEDHPWHYGLWFSWKYINHINYWEEDRQTGKAEGATRWKPPAIETKPDGSALIRMELTYTSPKDQVDLTETRELAISAPAADGSYSIDWLAHFTAGKDGAELDRTPMPGEPNGQVNGGYAGLGLRMAAQPLVMSVVTTTGPVTRYASDRARPAASAVGCNFTEAGRDVGALAIFSDPVNSGENAPWYLINSDTFRFACAAILAPKVIKVAPEGKLELHYRIAVSPRAWTIDALKAGQAEWLKAIPSPVAPR